MKRRIPILSTASVFFIVLILLVSCGIATIFTFGTGTVFTAGSFTGDKVALSLNVDDSLGTLSLIDSGSGPSLMLFYTITDSENPQNFKTAFNTTYKRDFNGVQITSDAVLTVNDITLYRFSDTLGTTFQGPEYIATADVPISPDFNCTLIKTAVSGTTVSMDLVFDVGSYTIHNSPKLHRFNGQPFETDIKEVDESFEDYHIDDQSPGMFLHIYGAVNVSKGSFNNIYWTDLVNLGYITL
ncbi:hypothetical protein [Sphaerochaeta sp. S2]|uniref:hypothetical protein n=1 Tax=Sphaerochaeta sp. S2 TaxID=2798868 RepID=UPI0018E93E34|nr:hypothetical protein [Sphaerochaeta sp. S2]MBJ2355836.1 hypothetical protein [Sphaerochaeta sp. S2]